MSRNWTHLIRFVAEEDGQIHLGNINPAKYPDIGLSTFNGETVTANVVTGSIFDGIVTDRVFHVKQVWILAMKLPLRLISDYIKAPPSNINTRSTYYSVHRP